MAANRRRLGVAVLLDPPVSYEVDGLRRAVGDPSLYRIPAHVTLVPPVNVRHDDLPAALSVLRHAAAVTRPAPLTLTLGAVTSFLPANPVLYLGVGGDLEGLRALRDAVFAPPLDRKLSWPWVPHVTLADGAPEDRIASALDALKDYTAIAIIDRVVLLEEGPRRHWTPMADVALGPPARIGTGGLTVELVRGRLLDPRIEGPRDEAPYAVNAYREGLPVGWARAVIDRDGTHTEVFVLEEHRRQGIGRHLSAHLQWALDQ